MSVCSSPATVRPVRRRRRSRSGSANRRCWANVVLRVCDPFHCAKGYSNAYQVNAKFPGIRQQSIVEAAARHLKRSPALQASFHRTSNQVFQEEPSAIQRKHGQEHSCRHRYPFRRDVPIDQGIPESRTEDNGTYHWKNGRRGHVGELCAAFFASVIPDVPAEEHWLYPRPVWPNGVLNRARSSGRDLKFASGSRGLQHPVHCTYSITRKRGFNSVPLLTSPVATDQRRARRAACADPGPGRTDPRCRLPEVASACGPRDTYGPLCFSDTIPRRANGGEVLCVLLGIKGAETIRPRLNTRRVHLFFDNLTSPRRSEPRAIYYARSRPAQSRRPRRRLRGSCKLWRVGLVPRPNSATAWLGQRSRTAALAVAAINYFPDSALK